MNTPRGDTADPALCAIIIISGIFVICSFSHSHLSHQECYSFEDNPANADSLGCKSYFISQTVSSPRPITMDLSLPVPKGMFRTPNPTPPGSRATTPGASPKDILSPVRTNSPDVPSLMNFQVRPLNFIDITSTWVTNTLLFSSWY